MCVCYASVICYCMYVCVCVCVCMCQVQVYVHIQCGRVRACVWAHHHYNNYTPKHLVCSMLIINPVLQRAHTRLLAEPFGHLSSVTHTHTHTHTVLLIFSGVVSIQEDNRNDGACKRGFGEIRFEFIPHDIGAHNSSIPTAFQTAISNLQPSWWWLRR